MKLSEKISSMTVLAPALFAVSFVLAIYLANIGEVTAKLLPLPLAAAAGFAVLATLIFCLAWRDRVKGAIFASIFTVLFFSYGSAHYLLAKWNAPSYLAILKNDYSLLPVWLAIMAVSFFLIARTSKNLLALAKFFLAVSFFSVLIPLPVIANYEIQRIENGIESASSLPKANLSGTKDLPDIYYLLPDSYSASSVIKKYFGYDNGQFVDYLQKKGFYVPSYPTSNYPKTFLSLASTLNMEYLDGLSKYKNSSDQTITAPLIKNNTAMLFLQGLGYKYYQLGSWWDPTNINPNADANFIIENEHTANIGDFNSAIIKSTMLQPVASRLLAGVSIGVSDEDKRARILYQFDKLPQVAKLTGPKFVFAHIIAPHEPYVFGPNCELIGSKDRQGKTDEQNYDAQVSCINIKLESTIDSILSDYKDPKRQPVILIQSDEGAPFLRNRTTPTDSWGKASDDLLRQKFPIFSAYYLPGLAKPPLYPTVSNVNAFREIFDAYFGTNLAILPDKNYIFPNTKDLYDFTDVTSIVSAGNQ